jgi:hypothetical protein
VIRDNFTARLYHQRAGYWGADRRGLEPVTAQQRAAALDLLAGGREDAFTAAAQTLIGQGDDVLALQIIEPGLLRRPAPSWPDCAAPLCTGSWSAISRTTRSGSSSTPSSPRPR